MNKIAIVCLMLISTFASSSVWALDRAIGAATIPQYNGYDRMMIFGIHKALPSNHANNGLMRYLITNGTDSMYIDFDVICADIVGQDIWIAGVVSSTDRPESWVQPGNWLFVKAHDGGATGSGLDTIGWSWLGLNGQSACDRVKSHGALNAGDPTYQVINGDITEFTN